MPKLTDQDRRAIIAAWVSGEKIAITARRYGIHESEISRIGRRYGKDRLPNLQRQLWKERIARAVRLDELNTQINRLDRKIAAGKLLLQEVKLLSDGQAEP